MITSLVLLLAGSLSAQTNAPSATLTRLKRPEQVFSKKIFWTEVGAYTLSNVLDGYTTVAHPRATKKPDSPEQCILLGQHPSAARYVATMGALRVMTFAAYRLQHSQTIPGWSATP
jgi:hypothetical protein